MNRIKQIAIFHQAIDDQPAGWDSYKLAVDASDIDITENESLLSRLNSLQTAINGLNTSLSNKFDKTGGSITGDIGLQSSSNVPKINLITTRINSTNNGTINDYSQIIAHSPTSTSTNSIGNVLLVRAGGNLLLGGGESADTYYQDNDDIKKDGEQCHILADSIVQIHTNISGGTTAYKNWVFTADGKIEGPNTQTYTKISTAGQVPTTATKVVNIPALRTSQFFFQGPIVSTTGSHFLMLQGGYGIVQPLGVGYTRDLLKITDINTGYRKTSGVASGIPVCGSTYTRLTSCTFPKGKFVLQGDVNFGSNSSNYRQLFLTTVAPTTYKLTQGSGSTATTSTIYRWTTAPSMLVQQLYTPVNGGNTLNNFCYLADFSANTTVYLGCFQNATSGTVSIRTAGVINGVKVSNWY